MKLRTKATVFFGIFLLAIAASITLHTEYVVGGVFKEQAIKNLRIIAEQSESAYLSFLGSMKVRVLDWTSDNTVREMAKAILTLPKGSAERTKRAQEFATYLKEKKMPFDKTIFLADLLDKNGVVVASTNPERVGRDERAEESEHLKVHDFDSTIKSNFGEVYFGTIVLDGDNQPGPSLNVTARLFDVDKDGNHHPIDAVLLVYFANSQDIANVLGSGTSIYAGLPETTNRMTSRALLEGYSTSDLYLVNNEHLLVTPSRTVKNVRVKQKVDTLPVYACLEKGKEINEEYDNYQGVRVLGASMCFQKENLVVIAEIEKEEIFAPLTSLIRTTAIGVAVALILGIMVVVLFIRIPLSHINNVVLVAKRVARGDLDAQVDVHSKDEVGYLADSFNTMIASVRNSEKELRASKYKVEEEKAKDDALLASLGEGMIATDNEGRVIRVNKAAEKILGWTISEIAGKKLIEVVPAIDDAGNPIPAEQRICLKAATIGTTSALTGTMHFIGKDECEVPVAVTATPVIINNKNTGAVVIFRDVTKEKEIEKTRGDLLSLASHQLRTPLSGTKWLIETLRKGLHGPLTAGQTEYLDEIYKINERMTSLVHDMLGVLRMEGDGAPAKKERVSTKALLASVTEMLREAAEVKHISIQVVESADYTIETDNILLGNILESLVSNAINYSEAGREVVMSVAQKDSELVFAVKDSGIGIPKDEQRQIFERFYRASNAKTFDTRGSGLGLYIANTLAKKIGARLSFESETGKGSTFYVHLPYPQADALPENSTRV